MQQAFCLPPNPLSRLRGNADKLRSLIRGGSPLCCGFVERFGKRSRLGSRKTAMPIIEKDGYGLIVPCSGKDEVNSMVSIDVARLNL